MFVSDAGYWDPGSVPRSTRVPPVLPATDVSLLPLLHPPRTPLALRCWKPTSKRLTSPVTSHSPPPLISYPLPLHSPSYPPSSHALSLSPLSLPELWSWSPTARADCWPRHWLHPHIPPPPVLGHPLPLWAGPPEVHHGPGGHTHLTEQSSWISHQALPHGEANKSCTVWGLLSCCSMVACLLPIKTIGNVPCKILSQLLSDANLTQCWTKPVCVACQ